ncbi:MAG: PKD repeat protein, partial [Chitinophagales bacterium]
LWLTGDSTSSTGGFVNTWYDLSGNNNHAFQANSTNQPTVVSSDVFNNQKVILFDGINDALGTLNPILTTPNFSIFIVFNGTSSSQQSDLLSQFQGSAAGRQIWGVNRLGGFNFFGGGTSIYNVSRDFAELFSIINTSQPNSISTYRNGGLVAQGDLSNVQLVPMYIGARDISGTSPFTGELAEIIIYDQPLDSTNQSLVEKYLMDKYAPPVNLGGDVNINYGFCPVDLDAGLIYTDYLWSTGESTQSIEVYAPGTYWVEVLDVFNRISYDSIEIIMPILSAPPNPVFCLNDSILWSSNLVSSDYIYDWSNGSVDSAISIFNEDDYYLILEDSSGCKAYSDTISSQIDSFELIEVLGLDTNLCVGNNFPLFDSGNSLISSYLWSTGDTTASIQVQLTGNYWVELINVNNCKVKDTITINILGNTPTALFSVDTFCMTQEAAFIDQSVVLGALINSWDWDFGNSDTSILPNPTTSYLNSGSYLVNFQIGTTDGCYDDTTMLVEVKENPNANFSFDVICAGTNGLLIDESLSNSPNSLNSWFWDFGGGQTSNIQVPAFTLNSQGNYSVSLTVINEFGCIDSLSKIVEVFPAILPDFTIDKNCIGDTTLFTDITPSFSIINRTWDFDLSNQTSSLESPSFYYPTTGSYNVSLSVSNAIGCQNEIIKTVEVRNLPVVDILFDNTCEGAASLLYDNSNTLNGFIASQTWDIEGNTFMGDTISYVFDAVGDYPISLDIIDNFNCQNDTSIILSVFALPVANFDFSPNYGSSPIDIQLANESSIDAISYLWDFGDGSGNSIDENPLHQYSQNGVYDIFLVASTLEGCADSATRSISIIPTELDIELSDFSIQKTPLADGSLAYKPSILLKNVGTRTIFNVDLSLSVNNETQIAESWEGVLNVGQSVLYALSSFAIIDNESLVDYICLEAQNVNDNTELNFTNNKICVVQNGSIQSSDLYPNPAKELVQMDIVMEKKGQAQIGIFDMLGKAVVPLKDLDLEEGYNLVSINTAYLQAGKYLVNLVYQDELVSYPLIIQNP